MDCFVDSSGFYAFLDERDPAHESAVTLFQAAGRQEWVLRTNNYVALETAALVQSRLGWDPCDLWLNDILSTVQVDMVDEDLHKLGMARWRQARLRGLSLTDCVSFAYMEQEGLREAIAYDRHFMERGIRLPKVAG